MFSLAGLNALITGGTAGIGLATARRFAAAGAKVAIVGRREATDLAKELNGEFIRADVTDEAQLRACFEEAEARLGKLDIVMNNAGIDNVGPTIAEQSADEFQRILEINLKAVYNGLRFAPLHMNDGGSIINTGSDAAKLAFPGYGQYSATKAAVCSLTQVAAMELVSRGIRVNAICPGSVWSEMLHPDHPEVAITERLSPMGRVGEPEEIAALCHFLAAPDCRYLTGQSIYVDGGNTGICRPYHRGIYAAAIAEVSASRRPAPRTRRIFMTTNPLANWHRLVDDRSPKGLDSLLADTVVFHSPIVHTPQVGKEIATQYLTAAFHVLVNDSFQYVREVAASHDAVLEFQAEIEGITVNGVDMIKWDDEGKIVEFKVMLRPIKAINLIHQKMAAMLLASQ